MTEQNRLLEVLVTEFRNVFRPVLAAAAALPDLTPAQLLIGKVSDSTSILTDNGLRSLVEQIAKAISALDAFGNGPGSIFDRLNALGDVYKGLTSFDFNQVRLPGITQDISNLGLRLMSYLVDEYLGFRFAPAHEIMRFIGSIEYKNNFPVFQLRNIPNMLSDPMHLPEYYGWGTSAFRVEEMISRIMGLASAFRFGVDYDEPAEDEVAYQGNDSLAIVPYFFIAGGSGLRLAPLLETTAGSKDAGIALIVAPTSVFQGEFLLVKGWNLFYAIDGIGKAGFAVGLRPGGKITTGFLDGSVLKEFSVLLRFEKMQDTPWVICEISKETRLEVQDIRVGLEVTRKETGSELCIESALSNAKIIISSGDGDGFLQKVLPKDGISIDFDLAIGWSNTQGLYFRGGAGLEVTLPINKELLGLLKINSVYLAIMVKESGISIAAAASVAFKMGPVTAAVEQMGLLVILSFPEKGGNLGPVNLKLGFKPPKGVGLAINASVVKGGGYLYFDFDKKEYAGVLELTISKLFSLKAIGLITTRMPDGSNGFSLLLIVTVDFSPIQLGYGFTLNGVGGLAGFNRTMKLEVLRDGIKNHTLDSILFPPDPVANAAKIISDLQSVFPAAPDRFVFAPMAKIAWGKSILLIEIGIAVELPSPLRLAIMGKVHLLLPPIDDAGKQSESKKAVEIHMDVLGILDLDKNEISVDAVLYDSRLAIFPITGGMALRLRWGTDPVFLLSVGGINHRFAPPPDFPVLDRVGIQLSYDKDGLRAALRLESYVAVTANTLQFGARIDAYAEVSSAKISGYLGFDALFEGPPLRVIVDIYGGVTVRAFVLSFSCDILLTLTGFEPINGDGHVTVDFIGKHEFPVHFVIGESKPLPPLPIIDPLVELIAALNDLRNWSAVLPSDGSMLVTMRQPTPDEVIKNAGQVLAHPLGELSIRQKVLPFGIALERFGAGIPASPGPFTISQFTLGKDTNIIAEAEFAVRDSFARGQFVNLSEDDKLTGPSFEEFICGHAKVGTEKVTSGVYQAVVFDYEVTIVDSKAQQASRQISPVKLSYDALQRAAQFGATQASSMELSGVGKYAGPSKGIKVKRPKYKVANTDDLNASDSMEFDSYTEAEAKRRTHSTSRKQQVVEAHEMA